VSDFEPRSLRMLALIAALALAAPVFADYKQDYARGADAAGDENWSEVESLMRKALAGSTTPLSRTRLYGQRFEAYVPQYYLGLAAYRQGDCTGAMRWFGDPAAATIINDSSQFKGIADEATRTCKSKLASVQPPTKPVQAPPVQAPPVQAPIDRPVVNNVPAQPPVQAPTTPTSPTANPPVATVPPLPSALQGLLDDYLNGRFSKAATADANTLSNNARFHALLLRSASRYTLFELQPAEAASQKSAAEGDVRIAKSLAPGKTPDVAFFSPHYRKFFSEVR